MKQRMYLKKMLPQDLESFYTMAANEKVMASVNFFTSDDVSRYTTSPK